MSLGRPILLKLATLFEQSAFAQQATGARLEARKEEELLHRFVFYRRQAVAAGDPVFGAEIIEVEPQRWRFPCGHAVHVVGGQLTGEGGDDYVGRLGVQPFARPLTHLDALLPLLHNIDIDLRTEALERAQIIHPQAHRQRMLGHQLPGQAPGHADVTEVIDHGAENVPAGFRFRHAVLPLAKNLDCPHKCARAEEPTAINLRATIAACPQPSARRPPCPTVPIPVVPCLFSLARCI